MMKWNVAERASSLTKLNLARSRGSSIRILYPGKTEPTVDRRPWTTDHGSVISSPQQKCKFYGNAENRCRTASGATMNWMKRKYSNAHGLLKVGHMGVKMAMAKRKTVSTAVVNSIADWTQTSESIGNFDLTSCLGSTCSTWTFHNAS